MKRVVYLGLVVCLVDCTLIFASDCLTANAEISHLLSRLTTRTTQIGAAFVLCSIVAMINLLLLFPHIQSETSSERELDYQLKKAAIKMTCGESLKPFSTKSEAKIKRKPKSDGKSKAFDRNQGILQTSEAVTSSPQAQSVRERTPSPTVKSPIVKDTTDKKKRKKDRRNKSGLSVPSVDIPPVPNTKTVPLKEKATKMLLKPSKPLPEKVVVPVARAKPAINVRNPTKITTPKPIPMKIAIKVPVTKPIQSTSDVKPLAPNPIPSAPVTKQVVVDQISSCNAEEKRLRRLQRAFIFLKKREEQLQLGFKVDQTKFAIVSGAMNVPLHQGFIFDESDSGSETQDSPSSSVHGSPQSLSDSPSKKMLSASAASFNPLFSQKLPSPECRSSSPVNFQSSFYDDRIKDAQFDEQFNNNGFANKEFDLQYNNNFAEDFDDYDYDYTSAYSNDTTTSPESLDGVPGFDALGGLNPYCMPAPAYKNDPAFCSTIRVVSQIQQLPDKDGKFSSKVRILPPENPEVDPLSVNIPTIPSMGPFGPIASALAMTQGGLLAAPLPPSAKPKFTISLIGEQSDAAVFG